MSAVICLLCLLLCIPGCVNDDLTVCGASIRFQYTRNIEQTDRFSSEVSKVNLFVFDSQGLFVEEHVSEGKQLQDAPVMMLNIPPGVYDMVAWGNLYDDYEYPPLVCGKTHIDDFILSLKHGEDDVVETHPGALFHGALLRVEIYPDLQKNQRHTIDMIKNTNEIKVIASGLSMAEYAKRDSSGYSFQITSTNGDYGYDNTIVGSRLDYIPKVSVKEEQLVSDFVVMRELNDGSTDSQLTVTGYTEAGEEEKLFDESLTDILLAVSATENLEIEDFFEIELFFDYTHGSATIRVKGWNPVDTGDGV
ncbi:MAG: FimB/Mfa2 family fimbrial subunit [Bacteroidales bacterium]